MDLSNADKAKIGWALSTLPLVAVALTIPGLGWLSIIGAISAVAGFLVANSVQ